VLKDVRIGDVLLLERTDATDSYRIVSTIIVDPSDVSVLEPTPNALDHPRHECFPFYYVGSAPRRFIVQRTAREPRKITPAGGKSRQASRAVSRSGGK
jgi:sortase A